MTPGILASAESVYIWNWKESVTKWGGKCWIGELTWSQNFSKIPLNNPMVKLKEEANIPLLIPQFVYTKGKHAFIAPNFNKRIYIHRGCNWLVQFPTEITNETNQTNRFQLLPTANSCSKNSHCWSCAGPIGNQSQSREEEGPSLVEVGDGFCC